MTMYPGMTVYAAEGSDEYEVLGSDMQVLHVTVPGGKEVQTEPGSMLYMQSDLKYDVNLDSAVGRALGGNCCVMGVFTNESGEPRLLGLTPDFPAKVISLAVDDQTGYRCKSGSYLAGVGDVKLGFDTDFDPATCCCAGQGCIRQTVGGNGTGFLKAMGTIVQKTLSEGEVIVVDTESLVAWEKSVKLGIRLSGNLAGILCGGEGLFNTTLTGPGTVYIQSMSFARFKKQMTVYVQGKKDKPGEGGGAPETEAMLR